MAGQAFLLAAVPFAFGLVVGRWWLLPMLALPGVTVFAQALHAGAPSGPVFVMLAVPLLGACVGVALRSGVRRGLDAR